MRRFATDALEFIEDSPGAVYDPGAEQDEDDGFLRASTDELLDTALLAEVRKGHSLDPVTTDDLRRSIALYALAVGEDPEKLTIFVRRRTPVQLARKGIVATLVDQSLTKVKDALFAFDREFDFIIYPDHVHILHQKNFEALFKESEAVLAKTAEWVAQLKDAVPMSAISAERLSSRIRSNSLMRRRVQTILRSDYLQDLTPEILRAKMVLRGMEPEEMMDEDGIVLNEKTEKDVLELLNEGIWTGDFSGHMRPVRSVAASWKLVGISGAALGRFRSFLWDALCSAHQRSLGGNKVDAVMRSGDGTAVIERVCHAHGVRLIHLLRHFLNR